MKTVTGEPEINAGSLAQCELFNAFALADLREVLGFSKARRVEAGQQLFEEEQPCLALHLVLEGSLKMSKTSIQGKEQVMRLLGPGQIFGAAPLFTAEGTYPATATALKPSLVLAVPKARLIRFLKQKPELMMKVLAFVSQHLQEMMRLVERVSLDKVPRRLALHLLERAKKQGGPRPGQALTLDQTQTELAAALGSVREVVGRTLRQFEKQGLLKLSGPKIVILDPGALARY
jgi:CRP-like cAMP-binding protein